MTWNVLVGRNPHESAREVYEGWADVTVAESYEETERLDDEIEQFDAVVLGGFSLPAERLERASNLKTITSPGVGLDAVDIGAATERGIVVCNNRGANTRAVAEYTIGAMLAVRRGFRLADRDIRSGTFEKFGYTAPEAAGRTMGVFGYGDIGRLVTTLAQGLDMQTVAYDPYVDDEAFDDGVERVRSKSELFERADAVGVHAPLTDETRAAIGEAELRALGADGILVNASRGPLVDTDDLVSALREDVVHGAAIDVFDEEPTSPDHPLFDLENVLVTPHIAGSTRESVPAKQRGAAENVRMVYEGELPETTVNRDRLCLRFVHGDDGPDSEATLF